MKYWLYDKIEVRYSNVFPSLPLHFVVTLIISIVNGIRNTVVYSFKTVTRWGRDKWTSLSVNEIYLNSRRMHWHACESEMLKLYKMIYTPLISYIFFHGVHSKHECCL